MPGRLETPELQYGCRENWSRGQPHMGSGGPHSGKGRTEQVLTAHGLIFILALGTGTDAVTDPAGWEAAPPVVAQEACPVHQRHAGLGP